MYVCFGIRHHDDKRRWVIIFKSYGANFIKTICNLLERTTLTFLPVVFLLLYVMTTMLDLLPIPWTTTAELFPLDIREVAHSIIMSVANLIMFFSIQSYRSLSRFFGGSSEVQYFFGVVALLSLIYTFIFLPETHRKKLSEIENYFYTNTTYIGHNSSCAKKKSVKNSSQARKQIVRNSRATGKDFNTALNGQDEKMMNSC